MNDQYFDDSNHYEAREETYECILKDLTPPDEHYILMNGEGNNQNYKRYNDNIGRNLFDVESESRSVNLNPYLESKASQQYIMRNDDSLTSKQTNDYVKDLLLKHQL